MDLGKWMYGKRLQIGFGISSKSLEMMKRYESRSALR